MPWLVRGGRGVCLQINRYKAGGGGEGDWWEEVGGGGRAREKTKIRTKTDINPNLENRCIIYSLMLCPYASQQITQENESRGKPSALEGRSDIQPMKFVGRSLAKNYIG